MIKLFRNIRKNLLVDPPERAFSVRAGGKTSKYLKYAIGEIILVVVGILIALQINNWNETKKEKKYLNTVYAQIQKDLQSDTLTITPIIKFYSQKNKRLIDIIERAIPISFYDTINKSNYANCDICRSDVSDFDKFQNLGKGHKLLLSINTDQNFKADSLSFEIEAFYTDNNQFLTNTNTIFSDIVRETINDYQKYDWFVEWSAFIGRTYYDKAFLTYIFESEEHRTKSARHLIFSKYYVGGLKNYKKDATELLLLIDEKLKE
jgi:hypothetical protein